MIFEGSEKKFELVVRGDVSLLDWPESRHLELVNAAKTQILSKIENSHVKAYLLSESSLFVWRNRMTMITCGNTTLVNAAEKAFEWLHPEQIETFFYQRKNEYFPQLQRTGFFNDISRLNSRIAGLAFRLGRPDEHHLFLFHSDRPYNPQNDDTTLEILMYGLQGKAREIFNTPGLDVETIRRETGVADILPGYQIDDFAFSPVGYSLNAIREDRYFTIHVTPQDESPYVSFETNMNAPANSPEDFQKLLQSVLEVFRPQSFDLVYFEGRNQPSSPKVNSINGLEMPGYELRAEIIESLSCGYDVHYVHRSQSTVLRARAHAIEIESSREGL
jgi:S-adenosylmethionine decarboxylase